MFTHAEMSHVSVYVYVCESVYMRLCVSKSVCTCVWTCIHTSKCVFMYRLTHTFFSITGCLHLEAADQKESNYGQKPKDKGGYVQYLDFSRAVGIVGLDMTIPDPHYHKRCTWELSTHTQSVYWTAMECVLDSAPLPSAYMQRYAANYILFYWLYRPSSHVKGAQSKTTYQWWHQSSIQRRRCSSLVDSFQCHWEQSMTVCYQC